MLAALADLSHLLRIGSWGFARLPPACIFKSFIGKGVGGYPPKTIALLSIRLTRLIVLSLVVELPYLPVVHVCVKPEVSPSGL